MKKIGLKAIFFFTGNKKCRDGQFPGPFLHAFIVNKKV